MARKAGSKVSVGSTLRHIHIKMKKKTTIGRKHSMIGFSCMNKNKRRSYKKYRGQGK